MRGIIFGVIGVAIGFTAGYFVGEKRSQRLAEKEIEEMRKHYLGKDPVREVKERPNGAGRPVEPCVLPEKPSVSSITEGKPYKEYLEHVKGYRSSEDYKEDMDNMGKLEPKLIKAEEFGELPNYDTEELLYFPEEDSLQNEDEEEIEDRESVLGDCMTKFGFMDNDDENLFVRNFRDQTDYHVRKIF